MITVADFHTLEAMFLLTTTVSASWAIDSEPIRAPGIIVNNCLIPSLEKKKTIMKGQGAAHVSYVFTWLLDPVLLNVISGYGVTSPGKNLQ